MTALGNGLFEAEHYEDALSVREAELAMTRRIGEPGDDRVILSNLANSYQKAGRLEDALSMTRDLYAGLKLGGAEDQETLISANNYAASLRDLNRFEEARSLLRETIPVAQRVVGEDSEITLQLKLKYAQSLYKDDGSTLDDLCEAVATLEETARIARRVLGGAHPSTTVIEASLQNSRATLRARETPSPAESA
jgi:tetratricopeptide (TPR) repeat protein